MPVNDELGQFMGRGFVTFATLDEAKACWEDVYFRELGSRKIIVEYAKQKSERLKETGDGERDGVQEAEKREDKLKSLHNLSEYLSQSHIA